MRKLLVSVALLLLALSVPVYSQIVIKQCADGSSVSANGYCPEEMRVRENGTRTMTSRWGAIAVDTSPNATKVNFESSTEGQSVANDTALNRCRLKSCEIVAQFKNSCGAVAATAGENWVMGVGIDTRGAKAERMALENCNNNSRGKNFGDCTIWVPAKCAGSPH